MSIKICAGLIGVALVMKYVLGMSDLTLTSTILGIIAVIVLLVVEEIQRLNLEIEQLKATRTQSHSMDETSV